MAKRFTCWVIVTGSQATAFRARNPEDLIPTLKQLQRTQPDSVMKWFERGKLWNSPEDAMADLRAERDQKPPSRGEGWRPGGEHKDPRAQYQLTRDQKRARFKQRQRWDGPGGFRPRQDEPGGGKFGDRPPDKRPPGHRPQGHGPQGTGPTGHRPQGDRPQGARPPGGRPPGGRPPGHRPQGGRPPGDRPPGSGYAGHRPQGGRPQGNRPQGSGYAGQRPQGARPYGRPPSNRPRSDRPPSDRPPSNRSGGSHSGNRSGSGNRGPGQWRDGSSDRRTGNSSAKGRPPSQGSGRPWGSRPPRPRSFGGRKPPKRKP